MKFTNLVLAQALFCFVACVSGFSLGTRTAFAGRSSSSSLTPFPSTCLHADESAAGEAQPENEGEEAAAEANEDDTSGTDILSSPAFLRRKIDVLKSDIAKADEDIEETNRQVQEGKAEWGPQLDDLENEYKNIQERMTKQKSGGDSEATVQVVRKMLDVLDTFDRGFGVVKAETEAEKVIEAEYKNVYDTITSAFAELGVAEVETVGTEFDYEVHQAVMQRPSEDYEEGIVCEELQKGYILGEKLVRAAMVSVSA